MGFKDRWKNWPYWKRGIIIGLFIGIILSPLSIFVFIDPFYELADDFLWDQGISITRLFLESCESPACAIPDLVIIKIIFFTLLLGITGFIIDFFRYGKIKSKKSYRRMFLFYSFIISGLFWGRGVFEVIDILFDDPSIKLSRIVEALTLFLIAAIIIGISYFIGAYLDRRHEKNLISSPRDFQTNIEN